MTTMNETDRRRNLANQIIARDAMLDAAAAAMRTGDVDALVEAGQDIAVWLDGPMPARYPGVRARLLAGLEVLGFTRDVYLAALAELNARAVAPLAAGTYECSKCSGRGRLDWTRVAEGVCFQCKGSGKIVVR
jgi:hypothetical protein